MRIGIDSGGTFTTNSVGDYTYTFKTKVPASFDATATHSIGVYAYRNLAEADRAKELDLGLLARSITSTLHGFDPLESEVLP